MWFLLFLRNFFWQLLTRAHPANYSWTHEKSFLLWLFICWKTNLKKKNFFLKKWKTLFAEKMFLYGKKVLYWKIFLLKKTFFYREKYKWTCKKIYISFEKCIFMQKMLVLQIKYKSFLNTYSFCKKYFFDHKKYVC